MVCCVLGLLLCSTNAQWGRSVGLGEPKLSDNEVGTHNWKGNTVKSELYRATKIENFYSIK
jgi:hypothetical protein